MKKMIFISMAACLVFNGYAMDSAPAESSSSSSQLTHDIDISRMKNDIKNGMPKFTFLDSTKKLHGDMHKLAALRAERDILFMMFHAHLELSESVTCKCASLLDLDKMLEETKGFISIMFSESETVNAERVKDMLMMHETVALDLKVTKACVATMKKIMKLNRKRVKVRKNVNE